MQVTEINADGLKREFKVVVPAAHIQTTKESRLKEVARTVKIPGFRPGKVPMTLIQQRYGASVAGEVLEQAVNDGTHAALTEKSLRPALRPKVEITSYEEGKDLEFTVALEILPEITPMDFSTLSLVREKATPPESEVDETLLRMGERFAQTEKADRAAAQGDTVVIDFAGKLDGELFPGGAAEGYSLKLGSGSFIPGFEDQLVGKSAGDKLVVSVTFPAEYGNEALAGKPAAFDVTVHEVRTSQPVALDDALAKNFGMEDLDGLRKILREEIEHELNSITQARIKRKLLDALAEAHDFAVPEGMVEMEFDAIWKQVSEDRAQGRIDPSDAGKDEETIKADYRALAVRRVRLGLLLADVGQKNKITVKQEDLNQALMEEARRYPGQGHMVYEFYRKNPDAVEALRAPVFEAKVVEFILELASVTDQEVSPEDLRKDPDGENEIAAA